MAQDLIKMAPMLRRAYTRLSALSARQVDAAMLAAIVVLAAAARSYNLGEQSLWVDEGFSYWASHLSWRDLWFEIPRIDKHTPLYYSFLKLWSVFGDSEVALRSLSVVFGVLTVPCAYVLGRLVGTQGVARWLGAMTALVVAIHPVLVELSQDARAYSALAFSVALTLCASVWLMRNELLAGVGLLGWSRSSAALREGRFRARLAWASFVLGAALTAWFHNVGMLVVASVGAAALLWIGIERRWERGVTCNALLAGAAVVLLCAPAIPMLLSQTSAIAGGFWIEEPTPSYLAGIFGALLIGRFSYGSVQDFAYAGVVLVVALWGLWRIWRESGWPFVTLLAVVVALPAALAILFSVLIQPIVILRVMIWMTIPLAVSIGSFVVLGRARWSRLTLCFALFSFFSFASFKYHAGIQKEPWREFTSIIGRESQADDLVILASSVNLFQSSVSLFQYYFPASDNPPTIVQIVGQAASLTLRPLGGERPRYSLGRIAVDPDEIKKVTLDQLEELRDLSMRASSVWLLHRRSSSQHEGEIVEGELNKLRGIESSWDGSGLTLTLYR